MNHRLTIAAASSVLLATFAEASLIRGLGWMVAVAGAIAAAALAGTLTRAAPLPAAAGATAILLVASVPVLADGPWAGRLVVLVLALACAASAWRVPVLRVLAGAVTYLGALGLYLNAVFAGPLSAGRLIPTGRSLSHLLALQHRFSTVSVHLVPQVLATAPVKLTTSGAIGLIAIAVDVVAVRLRRPALAGLALLALFLAPLGTAASFSGFGEAISFTLAATGFLALLTADGRDRLRGWGGVVGLWQGQNEPVSGAPDVTTVASAGRRVGLAAVALALIVPLLLPSLSLGSPGPAHGVGPGTSAQLPAPVAQMVGQLSAEQPLPVLTYTTTAKDPQTQYLQLYVVNFDQTTDSWDKLTLGGATPVPPGTPMPGPPGVGGSTPMLYSRTSIRLGDISKGYFSRYAFLPLPYAALSLQAPGSWLEDNATGMVYSPQATLAGLRYTTLTGDPAPTLSVLDQPQRGLPASITSTYLAYDSAYVPALTTIAEQITSGKKTAYAKALALQAWFRKPGRFTYSLRSTIPNTPAGLLDFLNTNRRGFCEQFAFAMAVLARLVGIPSRVVIGYTAGSPVASSSQWQVTTADAHSWPELYFKGAGWLRFEPTPGGTIGQSTAVLPEYQAIAAGGSTTPGDSTGPTTGPSPGTTSHHVQPAHVRFPSTAPGPAARSVGTATHGAAPTGIWLLVALLALVVAMPAIARRLRRARRWYSAAGSSAAIATAWRELCDDLTDFGLATRASESPRALAARIAASTRLPERSDAALGGLARLVERARYASTPPEGVTRARLRSDLVTVRRGLAASARPAQRWRARLLPLSVLLAATRSLRAILDLAAGLELPGSAG